MKKIVLVLVALLFLASLYMGFRAADRLNEHMQHPTGATGFDSTSVQQNYLLVHVSETGGESSVLVSVWGLFVNYTSPPHLAFVSLYPVTDADVDSDPFSFFRLNHDATIPDRVIKKIERQYDIETNGYILLDNFAVTSIEAWLGQGSFRLPQQQPLSPQEVKSIITREQASINSICAQIGQNGFDQVLDDIRWTELLPEHFSTSLTAESWLQAMNTLTSAGNIESCEVFISY